MQTNYGNQAIYFNYGIKQHQQFESLLRDNDFYSQIVNNTIINYIYDKKINNVTQSVEETELPKNSEHIRTIITYIKGVFQQIIETQKILSQDNDQLFKGNQYFIIGKCTQDQKYLKNLSNFIKRLLSKKTCLHKII